MAAAFGAVVLIAMSGCTGRFREHQRLQNPTLRPRVEAYARLVLLREARVMQRAGQPWEWRRYEFNLGVCHAGTVATYSKESLRETISHACEGLAEIQKRFGDECSVQDRCRVSDAAKSALQRLIDFLEAARRDFSEVEPAEASIPSTEM